MNCLRHILYDSDDIDQGEVKIFNKETGRYRIMTEEQKIEFLRLQEKLEVPD